MSVKGNKIYQEWFYKSDEDFQFARVGLEDGFYTHVCFLCQQAVEKYLKGYLVFHKVDYERTHKLIKLLIACSKFNKDFKKFREECLILDQYYTSGRYPGGSFIHFSVKQAKESLEIAQKIMKFVQKLTEKK